MSGGAGLVRTRLSDLIRTAPPLDDFEDPAVPAWAGRIRVARARGSKRAADDEVAMAVFVRAVGGGPLRTFSGGLAHECGMHPMSKSQATLGWEGEAAHDFLVLMESEPDVVRVDTENVRIEGVIDGEPFAYTIDAELALADGTSMFVEVKRGPDDLRDARYRAVLAYVTEVCRRAAIPFIVVFRPAIWASRHHRRNCNLFAASARTTVEARHLEALERAASEPRHTYASLAEALEPERPVTGRAVLRALAVRGLVSIELAGRLCDSTPVRIRRPERSRRIGRAAPAGAGAPPATTATNAERTEEAAMSSSPPNRFPKNTFIRIGGAEHSLAGRQAGRLNIVSALDGRSYTEVGEDGVERLLDDAAFARRLESGEASVHTFGDIRSKLLAQAGEVTVQQAVALDPAVEGMLRQVDMLDDAGVPQGNTAIGAYMAKHWTPELVERFGPAAPAATLRHWRSSRGTAGVRHPREMIRMWGRGRRGPYGDEFVTEALGQCILQAKSRGEDHRAAYAAFADLLRKVNEGKHLEHEKPEVPFKIPHKATFKRWWDQALEEETEEPKLGPHGTDQAWHGAGRTLQADFAMHRVIVDHTRLRLIVVVVLDDGEIVAVGRPWLTLAICVRTRAVVAHLISFISPCAWTLGEIMRRMVLPKRPPSEEAAMWPILTHLRGVPAELVVDNAVEFRSYSAERAFRAAGIGVRWCKIKAPRYRSVGERPMKVAKDFICENVPGATIPPAEARRIGHDATKFGVCELDQLEGIANLAVALINIGGNRGILKRCPAQLFERDANAHGIRVMADTESFQRDFHAWEPNHQLTRSGIEVWGLRYGGDEAVTGLLSNLAGRERVGRRRANGDATATVGFCYDPLNIGSIFVWNPESKAYVRLRCMTAEYADGMPLFVHEQIREAAAASGEAFASEADRIAVRNRLLQAKRSLDPSQPLKAREQAMRILEATRLRQIAGNVVWSETALAQPVSAHDLISHDRAALTSFDAEVLNPRPKTPAPKRRRSDRDRRDAGKPAAQEPQREAPVRRRRAKGGYR